MVSIDEAIARERQLAKEQIRHIGTYNNEYSKRCKEWAKEHEQLAEWLEELKKRRSEDYGYLADIHQDIGYRKAIDDFADKIINLCDDGEFMNRFNEFTATTILELAEQLKAGEIE